MSLISKIKINLKARIHGSSHISSSSPSPCPDTWVTQFRKVISNNENYASYWFWDNFQWTQHSIWIGRFNKLNRLPGQTEDIVKFLDKIIVDLNQYPEIKSHIYIKFYVSRNSLTRDVDIHYLLLCDSLTLPETFKSTFANIMFESYQITEKVVNIDPDFKRMINHYISWNNFYAYYDLMKSCQY